MWFFNFFFGAAIGAAGFSMTKVAGNTVEGTGFTASETEIPASLGNTIVGAITGLGSIIFGLETLLLGSVGLVQSLSVLIMESESELPSF